MGQRSATESVAAILSAFLRSRTWKQSDLARAVDLTVPATRKRLEELQAQGVPLERSEEPPYVYWSVPSSWFPGGVKLEVTPQITPEGNVVLDVDVTKDSVGRSTTAGFAINTKHVKTQVLVENGGTVVIGGIFEQNDREDVTKVPFLGDVPYLGNLFKTRTKSSSKTELLIFLTPKVLSDKNAAR